MKEENIKIIMRTKKTQLILLGKFLNINKVIIIKITIIIIHLNSNNNNKLFFKILQIEML